MRYQINDQVGDYKITGRLGSGGAGDVFRVEHIITGRVEAMKILYATMDADRAERILREAKIQARLQHPHLTELRHAFWHKGDMILVLEVVEGHSLKEIIARGPVPIATARRYALQLLDGLAHAHGKGVIHRDITPANILITAEGAVKLSDFGLAKEPHDRRVTMAGAMVGTVFYAAPEQIRSGLEADRRSDIYSCGVVLYELFTGRKPFEASTSFQMMMHHAETRPMPPQRLRDDIPPEFDRAILRAMEKDPAQRFSSALEFREALLGKERRPLPKAVYAACATLVVAAGTAAFVNRQLAQPPTVPAPPMPSVAIRQVPLPIGLFASGSVPVLFPQSAPVTPLPASEPAEPEPETRIDVEKAAVKPPVAAVRRTPPAPPVEPPRQQLKARIYGALTDDPQPAAAPPLPVPAPTATAGNVQPSPTEVGAPLNPAAEPQLPAPQAAAPQYEIQVTRVPVEGRANKGFWGNVKRINPFRRKPDTPAANAIKP